ncbi:hypothetical protein HYV91_02855 [Candidatus Wolfebacteria bacterium]|nr:hypothetical protein [Candidatus Wolfebacteria bacterium]
MAIIVEEEKNKFNWFSLGMALVILFAVVIAVYYLFFSSVPLIEKVIPERVQSIREISSADFRPDAILNNDVFKILRQYVNAPEVSENPARPNPFLPLR